MSQSPEGSTLDFHRLFSCSTSLLKSYLSQSPEGSTLDFHEVRDLPMSTP